MIPLRRHGGLGNSWSTIIKLKKVQVLILGCVTEPRDSTGTEETKLSTSRPPVEATDAKHFFLVRGVSSLVVLYLQSEGNDGKHIVEAYVQGFRH